jgi:hypothetical protein
MWFRRVYSIVDMTSGNKCCEDIQHFYLIASRFQRIKTNKQTNKKSQRFLVLLWKSLSMFAMSQILNLQPGEGQISAFLKSTMVKGSSKLFV